MNGFHPDGQETRIRKAGEADAGVVARLVVESWKTTYAGVIPTDYLTTMSVEEATERWLRAIRSEGVLVAVEPDTGIVGVGFSGTRRTAMGAYEGEIFALYVAESVQGNGIGTRLMAAMARNLLKNDIAMAFLWCLRDNPSRWFYERLGGRIVAERTELFAGAHLCELAYGWDDLTQLARLADKG